MAEQDAPLAANPYHVAHIVGSYVRHHQIGPDQLAALIAEVHQALAGLGRAAPPIEEALKPAVTIRRSVRPDHVICLECGFRAVTLRRHLRIAPGLEPADYRVRWELKPDHALTAPAYTAQRSMAAKRLGLGRKPAAVETAAAPAQRGHAVAGSRS